MSAPIEILEPEDIAKLLNAPDKRKLSGLRDRAILAVLFSTGVRVSELVSINVDDLKGNRITIFGKRKKYRLVLLSDFAIERVNAWLQARSNNHEALFTDRYGHRRIGVRAVQLLVKRHARDVGLPAETHTHSMRHAFAVDALRNGADIRQVQVMLGHSSPQTTAIYLTISDRMLEEAHHKHHDSSEVYRLL